MLRHGRLGEAKSRKKVRAQVRLSVYRWLTAFEEYFVIEHNMCVASTCAGTWRQTTLPFRIDTSCGHPHAPHAQSMFSIHKRRQQLSSTSAFNAYTAAFITIVLSSTGLSSISVSSPFQSLCVNYVAFCSVLAQKSIRLIIPD